MRGVQDAMRGLHRFAANQQTPPSIVAVVAENLASGDEVFHAAIRQRLHRLDYRFDVGDALIVAPRQLDLDGKTIREVIPYAA